MKLKKPIHVNEIKDFLDDVKSRTRVEILEQSKTNDILEIAKNKGIDLNDNTDLAGFKTIYALTDVPNANKCILPKEAVEASLQTLVGKPVDIDHDRRYVIGHYLEAELIDNQIIAYGVFYKSNFSQEWEEARELFGEGKLTTSFEIWCPKEKKEQHEDGTYSLWEIEFAGGGLLFNTTPAFKEAEVLNLAKKRCISTEELVFASEELIVSENKEVTDNKGLKSEEEGGKQVEENKVNNSEEQVEAQNKDVEQKASETPSEESLKESNEESKEENQETEESSKDSSDETSKDSENAEEAEEVSEEGKEESEEEKDQEEAKTEVKTTVNEETVETTDEKDGKYISDIKVDKDVSITYTRDDGTTTTETYQVKEVRVYTQANIDDLNAEIASLKEKLSVKDEEVKLYKENAKIIHERRTELGDFGKELTDEQLLDEKEYKIAKLTKDNSLLKASKDTEEEETEETKPLESGHTERTQTTRAGTSFIDEFAYGDED